MFQGQLIVAPISNHALFPWSLAATWSDSGGLLGGVTETLSPLGSQSTVTTPSRDTGVELATWRY
jgi:hypothetical protein